jgi:hypothetical protein
MQAAVQHDLTDRIPEDTFGARLAIVRQKMQWNISEAAEACGLKAATWTLWEHEVNLPRNLYGVCSAIADASGFSYDWLLRGGPLASPAGVRNRWFSPSERPLIPGGKSHPTGPGQMIQRTLPLFTRSADN